MLYVIRHIHDLLHIKDPLLLKDILRGLALCIMPE